MKESKTIEELTKSFEEYELRRLTVQRSEVLRKAQKKGSVTRNRTREINRIFDK